jgi:type I restriction enzyme S subunit
MSDGLPEGWVRTKLNATLEPGGLFDGPFGSSLKTSDYTDSGVRVIRLENLSNLRFITDKETYISEAKYQSLLKHTVIPEDILVGSFVDGAVRVCLLPNLPTKAIAKADCFTMRTRPDIANRRFVAFQLGTVDVRDAFVEDIHGATRPRITTKQLRDCELSLAPLPEQHRIVEKVEVLLEQVNRAKERLDRVPLILKRFRQAVLAAACSGELTSESELDAWEMLTIGSVAWVGTGSTPLRTNSSFYSRNGTPWITSAATALPFVTHAEEFVTDEAINVHRLKKYPIGTLLVAMYGEGKTRGQVSELAIEATINQAMAAIVVDGKRANREFVKLHLQGNYLQMRSLSEGGNQPNLNLSKIKNFPLYLPSLQSQKRIVARVQAFMALADTIERRVQAATARANKLPQAILSKAFSGELVPTEAELARLEGRTYETAEELLKRVTALGSDAPSARKGRGRRTG